jgi:hypothetical protein
MFSPWERWKSPGRIRCLRCCRAASAAWCVAWRSGFAWLEGPEPSAGAAGAAGAGLSDPWSFPKCCG